MSKHAILVVGAGFAGAVCARALADAGREVWLIDRRPHIAGNAYDCLDANGVLVHTYGPHIFHTNSSKVARWLSRFTEWVHYEHRVLAQVRGRLFPIPINRTTINGLYGLSLDERGVDEFLRKVRECRAPVLTSEDVVLNAVGAELCDLFFRGYTRKQWGLELSELSASVAARVPTRTTDDGRYFVDEFQAMPRNGYTAMFRRILDHPGITVCLRTEFEPAEATGFAHVVYTGRIDQYYSYCFGALPYRSLRFEHEHLPMREFQPVATVNYPNDHDYTRITEFKHITGQEHQGTSIVREYPQSDGEPFYPVPRLDHELLYQKYKLLGQAEPNVTFIGRLAQYRYYNMDQVTAAALVAARNISRLVC